MAKKKVRLFYNTASAGHKAEQQLVKQFFHSRHTGYYRPCLWFTIFGKRECMLFAVSAIDNKYFYVNYLLRNTVHKVYKIGKQFIKWYILKNVRKPLVSYNELYGLDRFTILRKTEFISANSESHRVILIKIGKSHGILKGLYRLDECIINITLLFMM